MGDLVVDPYWVETWVLLGLGMAIGVLGMAVLLRHTGRQSGLELQVEEILRERTRERAGELYDLMKSVLDTRTGQAP